MTPASLTLDHCAQSVLVNISAVNQATSTASSASAASGAPPAGDPFGFFVALQDQLPADTVGTISAAATTDTGASPPTLPALLTVDLDAGTGIAAETTTVGPAAEPHATTTDASATPSALPAPATPEPAALDISIASKVTTLLSTLSDDLKTLEDQLGAGDEPDPDLLDRIGDTIDAIAALLAPLSPSVQSPVAPASSGEAEVSAVSAASAGSAGSARAAPAPQIFEEIKALLASIRAGAPAGDSATSTTEPAASSASTTAADGSTAAAKAASPTALAAASAFGDPVTADRIGALLEKLKTARPAAESSDGAAASAATEPPSGTSAQPPASQAATPAGQPTITAAPAAAQILPAATQETAEPSHSTVATTATDGAPAADSSSDGTRIQLAAVLESSDAPPADPRPKASTSADAPSDVQPADAASTDAPDRTITAQPASAPATTLAPATAAAPRPLPAAYQPAQTPIDMSQMAVEIVRQSHQGASRFTIRLDPPELGRVDVKLEVDSSGAVSAQLTLERSETLDLFQRDQRTLERALAQAGLDMSKTSLEFSLRQDSFTQQQFSGQREQGSGNAAASPATSLEDQSPVATIAVYRGAVSQSGVNLLV